MRQPLHKDVHAMKRTAPLSTSVWVRPPASVPDQVLAYILAVVAELRRAIAAASRYEQLRLKRRASDDPDADPARRTFREFYSDR